MPNLYHTKRIATAIAATTSNALYPVANLYNDSISKPWRATATTQTDIDLTFTVGVTGVCLSVQDVNFASAEVWTKVGAGALAKVGDMTTYRDMHGRRRGRYVIAITGNLTQVRLRILNGTPTDGASGWTSTWAIGAITLWGVAVTLPPHEWGYDPRLVRARIAAALPSSQRAVATTGKDYVIINCRARPRAGESWDAMFDALRAGVCLFDTNISTKGWECWPVVWEDDAMNNPQTNYNQHEFSFTLREQVAV